jgi:hypothetical protein
MVLQNKLFLKVTVSRDIWHDLIGLGRERRRGWLWFFVFHHLIISGSLLGKFKTASKQPTDQF